MVEQLDLSARARASLDLVRAALDPGADTSRLDQLVRDAAHAVGAASGHVSMLTDRQVTASVQGLMAALTRRGHETLFEDSICANALRMNTPLVIPDTHADDRVSSLPAVADGAIGSYLGAPLRTGDGEMVGVLCVFDHDSRQWTDQQVADLSRIADAVVAELSRLESESG